MSVNNSNTTCQSRGSHLSLPTLRPNRLRKPRCFVAMAFDRDDTDALYDTSIRPVLKQAGLVPVIINRRESNDDLNHQIIESLNTCDCCIADLTYTRPSVYFEAGYAQRSVPVTYTVRADHLGRAQPDELRVHFDLQMKPLIRWRSPDDAAFRLRLERRLRATVLRDWHRANANVIANDAGRRAFSRLSLLRRLETVRRRAMLAFRPYGFRKWSLDDGRDNHFNDDLAGAAGLLVSVSTKGTEFRIACVLALESITLGSLRSLSVPLAFMRLRMPGTDTTSRSQRVHLVCISLRPVPAGRVERVFAGYDRGDIAGRLIQTGEVNIGVGASRRPVSTATTIDVVSGVKSEAELRSALHSLLVTSYSRTS